MKEYGGYLPFEFSDGQEYYRGENVVSLNCARNAIIYAIMDGEYNKIYIPFYMCETVGETLLNNCIPYEVYHLDCRFYPLDVQLSRNECLLYPNYFGLITNEAINEIVNIYRNVILDNTQAFFAKPHELAYNIYSCRKFIGVSDGAYVVKNGIHHRKLKKDISYNRMTYLLKCIELGTNEAYLDSLENEKVLTKSPVLGMSKLTKKILQQVNYDMIQVRRKQNYDYLYQLFEKKIGITKRPKECIPMVFPFVCDNIHIRKKLIGKNVYVPQWWEYLLKYDEINEFEKELTLNLLPLPIDQRYSLEDMDKLYEIVSDCLKGK